MTINLSMPNADQDLRPRITVVGVGGAGGNAVNNMINANLEGVNFVVCNTDTQSLDQSLSDRKIQLGVSVTRGLGAGSRPDVGRAAAEEALEEILEHINTSHMVFITAGMGGGTGTGAAPVIARAAREQGILTVGVVTRPFQFEGTQRMQIAEGGIEDLQQYVDTLIVIPNQNLFRVANEKTTFADAFNMADNVLHSGVRGVTDLMVMPGLINLDFNDIRTAMSEMGKAMMGTGEAEGDKRAIDAAEAAISNPLLDDVTMKGASSVLINITGGDDMTLFEVDEAANRIREEVYTDALIIFGSTFDESLSGKMRVSVVATGIDVSTNELPRTEPLAPHGSKPHPAATLSQNSVTPSVSTNNKSNTPIRFGEKPISNVVKAMGKNTTGNATVNPQTSTSTELAQQTKDSREPFIPPPPMVASEPEQSAKQAEPFAAAAIENAGLEAQPRRRRGLTLFERMTGAGRNRGNAQPATAMVESILDSPSTDQDDTANPEEPITEQPNGPTARLVNKQESEISEASQPPLKGLEEAKREPASLVEEEMLEIPAFLRRQAN